MYSKYINQKFFCVQVQQSFVFEKQRIRFIISVEKMCKEKCKIRFFPCVWSCRGFYYYDFFFVLTAFSVNYKNGKNTKICNIICNNRAYVNYAYSLIMSDFDKKNQEEKNNEETRNFFPFWKMHFFFSL